jgi:hypothetical protein
MKIAGEGWMADLKTRPVDTAVQTFLDAIADAKRRADARHVVALMAEISGEPAIMWGTSIIGFGRYSYRYDSGHGGEWMRIGMSPRKTALTLYILPGLEGHAALLEGLGRFTTGKSCLYIKRLADVDPTVLRRLIEAAWADMRQRYPE